MIKSTQSKSWFDYFFSESFLIGLIIILLLAGSVVGGIFIYRWYTISKHEALYTVLAPCQERFDQSIKMQAKGNPNWQDVVSACSVGYEQSSSVYFLPFQVEALIQNDSLQEAYDLLAQLLEKMSPSSLLYNEFKTKQALLLFDLGKNDQAIDALKKLIADANNSDRDRAIYYLGYYYFTHGDDTQAREVWQSISSLKPREHESPWLALIKEKMNSLQQN